ncbi:hypothetical protein [Dysgonomonas sp. 25]|uniref:hypothetical protein n=1 Tax=Dysgonomonas sp. 25 TaxID=2302933 RepID=UPI0013D7087B|nr:hypothetical protein [Dysgonomonas sp. 25]NDV67890.1 hypothetical protein [Dysgonomonas sp. 25]
MKLNKINMMKKYILYILTILFSISTFAQSVNDSIPFVKDSLRANTRSLSMDQNETLPELILPTPDAAALGKYGQYPVSLNTGLVQIDIPIYTINLPQTTVPISLSYHASGIKVDEIASMVGLGWSLNAGGVITRNVKGIPDKLYNLEKPPGQNMPFEFKYSVEFLRNFDSQTKMDYLGTFYDNPVTHDLETDIFHYNFCGVSGSFRLDVDGNWIQLPLTGNKIEYISGLDNFKITTTDGTAYYFGAKETVPSKGHTERHTTSWYLSWIKTIDGRSITFKYDTDNTLYVDYYTSQQLKIGQSLQDLPYFSENYNLSETEISLRVKEIEFPEGSIVFSYNSDRKDRRKYRMTGIDIYSKGGGLIKAYLLEQSYFMNGPRLRLDKVCTQNSSRKEISAYTFGYNYHQYTMDLPKYFDYFDLNSNRPYFGQDLWGYYNGISYNTHFISHSVKIPQFEFANRAINPKYTQACMLNKITYPTGGYTKFEYENNKNMNGEDVGGLRIKQILSYPSVESVPLVKTYQYENVKENVVAHHLASQRYTRGDIIDESQGTWAFPYGRTDFYDYYVSQPALPQGNTASAPVFYGKVIEFDGTPQTSNGKTEHFYNTYPIDIEYYDLSHCYQPDCGPFVNFKPYLSNYYVSNTWQRNGPERIDVYKKEDLEFSLIKSTKYGYSILNKKRFRVGLVISPNFYPVGKWHVFPPFRSRRPEPELTTYGAYAEETFQYANITVETGLSKLTKIEETEYLDGKELTTTTTYNYDRLQNQYEVTSTERILSDGTIARQNFEYPNDFKNLNSGITKVMIGKNMISPVITQTDYVNDTFVQNAYNVYKQENGLVVPHSVIMKKGVGEAETEIAYTKYDNKGNILEVQKRDNTYTTFIWGYNQAYLVAKLDNIRYNEVANNTALMGYLNQLQDYTYPTTTLTQLNNDIRRVLPSHAQVTTCTYIPLIGITTLTDPSGITTYCEYDNAGRLRETYIIEDGKRKPLQSYEYHYQNQ